MSTVANVYQAPKPHWVGNGFYVHSMFNYNQKHKNLDPFLLMDYAAPYYYERCDEDNTDTLRGVGEHPHRGFETVTLVFEGELAHADSNGGGGVIGAGDVQWMTAGSGVMHEEFHSKAFAKSGGIMQMVQLWVNLPQKDKMTAPRYQAIKKEEIAKVNLEGKGVARIIAGQFGDVMGAASTFSPINLWDVSLNANQSYPFDLPKVHNILVLVRDGAIDVDGVRANPAELITFHPDTSHFVITAHKDSQLLILSGEPLNEPIVGYGPFVMTTKEEISQALEDVRLGKMGKIVANHLG